MSEQTHGSSHPHGLAGQKCHTTYAHRGLLYAETLIV